MFLIQYQYYSSNLSDKYSLFLTLTLIETLSESSAADGFLKNSDKEIAQND